MSLGAAIGGIASIGGAIFGGNSQSKAIKAATKAQDKIATKNNALAKWNYGENTKRLDPYAYNGLVAGNTIMSALLGTPMPAPTSAGTVTATGNTTGPTLEERLQWLNSTSDNARRAISRTSGDTAAKVAAGVAAMTGHKGDLYDAWVSERSSPFFSNPAAPAPATPVPGEAAPTAQNAFDTFRNSTNYQFRLNEGLKALDGSLASKGLMDSGLTRKATQEYAQNFASNELGAWLDRLSGQQNVGMGAASALAGVGQNLVTNVSNNNQNAANAASNGALALGANRANMWNGIASGIGSIASSFGKPS